MTDLVIRDRVYKYGLAMKARRKELGYSIQTLADLSNVNYTTIKDFERGISMPRIDTILRIMDALGMKLVARPAKFEKSQE